jgi:hypothetical protein
VNRKLQAAGATDTTDNHMKHPMKPTYAFHTRATGAIELCDGDGNTIELVSADALTPTMVEIDRGFGPDSIDTRPFFALDRDQQDDVLYGHLECYCDCREMKLVELNHD